MRNRMQITEPTWQDTAIGLTVGFLFCVLCMVALGYWLDDNPPLGLDWQDYEAAYEALP